jgi:biotin synthase
MNAILQAVTQQPAAPVATKWSVAEVEVLYDLPLMDLIYRAQQVHREHFDANEIQRSTLISVKTGGCSEDCGYCSQSARNKTELEREKLMPVAEVVG